MRTTVEIRDEQRARLLKLAAERGEKGFSALVQEAVEEYLAKAEERDEAKDRALATIGSMSDKAADALEARVTDLRERWR